MNKWPFKNEVAVEKQAGKENHKLCDDLLSLVLEK